MGTNKNAIIRYHALDACLSNFKREFFIKDLIAACNEALAEVGQDVQKRQVLEDMKFIESEVGYATTIIKKNFGKQKYYRYESHDVSIRGKNPIMEAKEFAVLQSAINILQKVKGLPHYDWLEEIVPRLSRHFEKPMMKKEVIDFEDNKLLKGKHFLGDLFQYILEEKVLQVHYHPFTQPDIERWLIHPYYLKQHNNRWFCMAYVEQKSQIQTLALDRIIDVNEISFPYKPNIYIDTEQYFKDLIGVTRFDTETLSLIHFRIAPGRAPYIRTKPLHNSQLYLQKDENNWEYFSIEVIPNYELQAKILELGNHIEILSPEKLRTEIATRLQIAAGLYK